MDLKIKKYFWITYIIVVVAFIGLVFNVGAGPNVSQFIPYDLTAPGPIGGTTPASGSFTTLTTSGDVTLNSDVTIGAAKHLVLPQHNDATTPTQGFGDGDTGIYESSDDNLCITIAGTIRAHFGSQLFTTESPNSAAIIYETPSATNPVFTFDSDRDTGLGTNAADQLSLIAGGVEGWRISEATTITHTINGILISSPTTITADNAGTAASITHLINEITTDGDQNEDNVTVSDGTTGQIIIFSIQSVGHVADSLKITPNNMVGGTKISFAASPLGLGCTMVYSADGWVVTGNNGGTIS